MLAVLAPNAEWTSDGGGKVNAARRVVRGADRIARMLFGIEAKYRRPFTYEMTMLNGELALKQYLHGALFAMTFCVTDGERIVAFYRVMNPDKLALVTPPADPVPAG